MKQLLSDTVSSEPFQAFLADLEALQVTPVAEGGLRYARIAARSNPRWWLLPLEDRKAAAVGLDMWQPLSKAAAVAKAAVRGVVRFGPHSLLRPYQLRLSGLPDLEDTFSKQIKHVAWFTGTEGPHRKTALQVMDADGTILGYAKLSRAAHVRPYIRNEARALQFVEKLELTSLDIPQVLALRDDETVTMLVTDSRRSSSQITSTELGPYHLRLLEELRHKTESVGAIDLIEGLARQMSKLEMLSGTEWVRRVMQALSIIRPVADQIPVCFNHGDFTPWNTFFQEGRPYVFDWEYAHPGWPVGFDLVHFLMATISRDQQPESLSMLQDVLAKAHFSGDALTARRALLVSLVCHAVFYLGRLAEASCPLDDWADKSARSAMIDRLLADIT